MKRVLSVQDLSCLGKCSLSVALPVLSAMGCACTVLPTAVLSTHTAFPAPHYRSLTEDMLPAARHWKSVGAAFDGISVGYLADPRQTEAVEQILDLFDTRAVIDPVMGDHGRLYQGITHSHVEAMQDLSCLASALLHNVTEAGLLAGLPYQQTTDGQYLRQLLERLCRRQTQAVIITGLTPSAEKTGFVGIQAEEGMFSYQTNRIPKNQHGTGDLFSAVFSGAYLLGKAPQDAAALAAAFVERVLESAPEATPFGVQFEPHLPWLWSQI